MHERTEGQDSVPGHTGAPIPVCRPLFLDKRIDIGSDILDDGNNRGVHLRIVVGQDLVRFFRNDLARAPPRRIPGECGGDIFGIAADAVSWGVGDGLHVVGVVFGRYEACAAVIMRDVVVRIILDNSGLAAAEIAGDSRRIVPCDQAERAARQGNGRLPDHLQVQRCGGAKVVVIGERAARGDETREGDAHGACGECTVRFVGDSPDLEGTEMVAALHPYIADQPVELSKPGVVSRENDQPVVFVVPPLYHDEEGGFLPGGPARRLEAGHAVLESLPFCQGSPAEQAGTG